MDTPCLPCAWVTSLLLDFSILLGWAKIANYVECVPYHSICSLQISWSGRQGLTVLSTRGGSKNNLKLPWLQQIKIPLQHIHTNVGLPFHFSIQCHHIKPHIRQGSGDRLCSTEQTQSQRSVSPRIGLVLPLQQLKIGKLANGGHHHRFVRDCAPAVSVALTTLMAPLVLIPTSPSTLATLDTLL